MTNFFETKVQNLEHREDQKRSSTLSKDKVKMKKSKKRKQDNSDSIVKDFKVNVLLQNLNL